MSRGEKNIDRIFRDRLRNYDADPPVEVWNNIREKLYLDRRRKRIFWISRVAAGIALLTILSLTYFVARNTIKNKLISEDKAVPETEVKETVSTIEGDSSAVKMEETGPGVNVTSRIKSMDIERQSVVEQYSIPAGTTAYFNKEEKMNYITRKSILQLDYNIVRQETGISYFKRHDRAFRRDLTEEEALAEDLYTLNITEEKSKSDSRWAIGTEVSPLYSYRSLEAENNAAMALADNFNNTESGVIAYSGGVNVNYSLLKRLSLQSGIYYSRYGVNVDNAYVFEGATADISSSTKFYSINNSSGIIDIDENPSVDYVTNKGERKYHSTGSINLDAYSMKVNSGEITQNFEYIEVPLIIRYRLIDRKIGFNLLGGLSTNLLVGSNTYYHARGVREKIGETTDIKPFNYSSIVGLSFDYSISRHLNINLEPTFRYYLNSINQSTIIRSYPYSIGVFTGLRYNF